MRINQRARPRYLQGLLDTIIDMGAAGAMVSLERPMARFTTGKLSSPALALDRRGPRSA